MEYEDSGLPVKFLLFANVGDISDLYAGYALTLLWKKQERSAIRNNNSFSRARGELFFLKLNTRAQLFKGQLVLTQG